MFITAKSAERPSRSQWRAGDFVILTDARPAWLGAAVQPDMPPGRKLNRIHPGGESRGVMRSLLQVFELTATAIIWNPPPALSLQGIPPGRRTSRYEPRLNTPLCYPKDYEVTYSDTDMPTQYSLSEPARLDRAQYENSPHPAGEWTPRRLVRPATPGKTSDALADQAAKIFKAQREDGAWVEPAPARDRSRIEKGTPMLDARTFSRNIVTLARFIAAQ